jgi:hypothetical protein
MSSRIVLVVLTALVLSGCTDADWDHALSYTGLGSTADAPKPAATAKTQASVAATDSAAKASDAEDWCATVGKAAEREAKEYGFDAETQRHRAEQATQQCRADR